MLPSPENKRRATPPLPPTLPHHREGRGLSGDSTEQGEARHSLCGVLRGRRREGREQAQDGWTEWPQTAGVPSGLALAWVRRDSGTGQVCGSHGGAGRGTELAWSAHGGHVNQPGRVVSPGQQGPQGGTTTRDGKREA